MKFYRLKFLLFIVLPLMACSDRIYEQPSDKYPFTSKIKEVLGSNNVEIIDSINRSETQISYFEISKDSTKLKDIITLLEKDGWVLKGHGIGVDTYCLGLNNKINIVTPIFGEGLYDFKGGQLKRTNYGVNAVLYRYYKWGDDLCE
ncbi:hypothetical protein [Acinetobacter johnsonii]|uniref:hypothetical protein n=1 Tax=Acinetobacter johnsonii TaxID=40214 RepID=UPI00301A1834